MQDKLTREHGFYEVTQNNGSLKRTFESGGTKGTIVRRYKGRLERVRGRTRGGEDRYGISTDSYVRRTFLELYQT